MWNELKDWWLTWKETRITIGNTGALHDIKRQDAPAYAGLVSPGQARGIRMAGALKSATAHQAPRIVTPKTDEISGTKIWAGVTFKVLIAWLVI